MANSDYFASNSEQDSLFWLELKVSEDENVRIAQILAQLSIKNCRMFTEIDKCIQAIHYTTGNRITLVLDGQLSEKIIPQINQLEQVIAIYIYNVKDFSDQNYLKKYSKIKYIMYSALDLIHEIQGDLSLREDNKTSLVFDVVDRSSTNLDHSYARWQSIIFVMLCMDYDQKYKSTLIEVCQTLYKNDSAELKKIDKFEGSYEPGKAIWWYTQDSFLYRVLNRALRLKHDLLLISSQFLIKDIYEELKQLQTIQIPRTYNRVYRQQFMSKEEIAILLSCENQLISMNSFLSTTQDKIHAIFLVQSARGHSDEVQPVLFEIELASQPSTLKPYAEISSKSNIPNEKEVLFMLGSVFRVKKVFSDDNGLSWIIELSVQNNDENEFKDVSNYMKRGSEGAHYDYIMQYLFSQSNLACALERFLYKTLVEQGITKYALAQYYSSLGSINGSGKRFDTALVYFHKASEILEENFENNLPFVAEIYSSLAYTYFNKNDSTKALLYFEKSLKLLRNIYGEEHELVAQCYHRIGLVFLRENDFDQALDYSTMAFFIYEQVLPPNHRRIEGCHQTFSEIYKELGQYDLALLHARRYLEILLSSPCDDSDIGFAYWDIAEIYMKQKYIIQSIVWHKKALKILEKIFPSTDKNIIIIKNCIQLSQKVLQDMHTIINKLE